MATPLRPIKGFTYACHQFGDNQLQRIGVWERENHDVTSSSGYWVVYIHGGAWRDPKRTHTDFVPAIEHIVSDAGIPQEQVRGFASIDYRLSPHTDYSQPEDTPEAELRRARHPDHIQDVRSALALLHQKYNITDRYIVAGHSAGGTLSFQLLMEDAALNGQTRIPIPLPSVVIGMSGIYDLVALNERRNDAYSGFMGSAFSQDRAAWKIASPRTFSGSFKNNWTSQKFAILAHSREDSLVDMQELDDMERRLLECQVNVQTVRDLTGDHDIVWSEGAQLASLVKKAIRGLGQ